MVFAKLANRGLKACSCVGGNVAKVSKSLYFGGLGIEYGMFNMLRIVLFALFISALYPLSALQHDHQQVFSLVESNQRRIVLELHSPQAQVSDELVDGSRFSRISMEGAAYSAEPGMMELPLYGTLVAIPANAQYSLSYSSSELRQIGNLAPQPVKAEDTRAVVEISPAYYEQSSPQVVTGADAWLRDFRVLAVQASPVFWDQNTQTLNQTGKINITIELSYPQGAPAQYSSYSKSFERIYEAQILNFSAYRYLQVDALNPRILIIKGDNDAPLYQAKIEDFVRWKRQKGFEVEVMGSIAGLSNIAIQDSIKLRYNNPQTRPDYIILIGDIGGNFPVPTWFETESGYNGEGDYPYTYLSGDDMLGDAFVGRISAEDISQLGTMLNKIYAYEKNVVIDQPSSAWLDRILIIGDPTESGISCAYTGHYIQEMAEEAYPDYEIIANYEYGFEGTINSAINQGVSFFTYRGNIGTSGWSPSNSLMNGTRLPHAVVLTCRTGDFAVTSLSETFTRMGTEASPRGAVTCISMATGGTHTAFNNALISGIMGGIYVYGMRTMGEALLGGRIYLHSLYGATQPHYVRTFAHWCNLMGDPSLEAWVGIPDALEMNAPDSIVLGTNSLEIGIIGADGAGLEGVLITAFSPSLDRVVGKALTNSAGLAFLNFAEPITTDLIITAAKHDCKPFQKSISLDAEGSLVYLSHGIMDDGSGGSTGNSDGFANPLEQIALEVFLKNSSLVEHGGFNAILSTDNPNVQITQSKSAYPSFAPGAEQSPIQPFRFILSPAIQSHERVRFTLKPVGEGSQHLEMVFYLDAYNAGLSLANYSLDASGNGVLDPGESCGLNLRISNDGIYHALGLTGELRSFNSLVSITDSLSFFGDIASGAQALSQDGFGISGQNGLIPGMQIPLQLRLYNDTGFEQICVFNIPVGTVSQNTPLGPDEYGYLIYDMTDTAFPDCPGYDWFEIAPMLGGPGTLVPDLFDNGSWSAEGEYYNARALKTLDLPFTFPFYGIMYDQITVCVNGFIAMGITKNGDFRNARLPGGQGPSPMIAPFWDDLCMQGTEGIYNYYDIANHRYIVQYHEMRNGYDGETRETFQVIFYDPLYYPTGLGDGMIKIQYKTFNNIDVGGSGMPPVQGNFCTIGIKDHTNTRGLEYSFNNGYAPAAAPLGNGTAILITTIPAYHQQPYLVANDLVVTDLSGDGLLGPGETATLGIKLKNLGAATAEDAHISLSSLSPYATIIQGQSSYPDIAGASSAVNLTPFEIAISDSCPADTRINLQCQLDYDGSSREIPCSIFVRKTNLRFESIYLNDTNANADGILDPGETADLVVNIENNSQVSAQNITCTITVAGDQVNLLDDSIIIAEIPAMSISQVSFPFRLAETALIGSSALFNVVIDCEQIIPQNLEVLLRVGTTGLRDNFEASNCNYLATPAQGGWEWGVSGAVPAHSGTKLWGTRLNQAYPDNGQLILRSQLTYLGSDTILDFWHYCDMEAGVDGGNVKLYRSGYNPVLITPVGGYPYEEVTALGEPGFSGSAGWSRARFDLSPYAGQTVRLQWTFASDAQVSGQGWFIDDVSTISYGSYLGKVTGQVSLLGDQTHSSDIWLRTGSYLARADSTGYYELYLPRGVHNVTATAPGYAAIGAISPQISPDNPVQSLDFTLWELKPVTNISFSHTEDQISLVWNPPEQPYYTLMGYQILRKLNAGGFEEQAVITDTLYAENLVCPGTYKYQVIALYQEGSSLPGPLQSFIYPFTIDPDTPPVPEQTKLYANYPNPFNPRTYISFDLAESAVVELRIFNLRGQLIRTIFHDMLDAGNYRFVWDGRDSQNRKVSSGLYFYQLRCPGINLRRKMMLIE